MNSPLTGYGLLMEALDTQDIVQPSVEHTPEVLPGPIDPVARQRGELPEDPVVVVDQEPWNDSVRRGLTDLLLHPVERGVTGFVWALMVNDDLCQGVAA